MHTLNYVSHPIPAIFGEISVPGDKSISHRAVMLGAIAKGITTVNGFLDSSDCLATVAAFESMGVLIEKHLDQKMIIHGVGKYGLKKPKTIIDCGNAATCMRLLTGILVAQDFNSELDGDLSLKKRPIERIHRPLVRMGANIILHGGKPPIIIHKAKSITGIIYKMPQASAQVKSCLLLAGMYAKNETLIIEPGITRDHTERLLTAFSYPIQKSGNSISINSNGECIGTDIIVPGDMSAAAFFIVAATIIPNSDIIIKNVGINSTRMGMIEILWQMGANIVISNKRLYGEEPVADLHIKYAVLEGLEISGFMVPQAIDEFPILCIAAACAQGQTRLHGAHELRVKESDRIQTMTDGLISLGIEAKALKDGLLINGGELCGGTVDSHYDHRISMAFAIAGAVARQSIIIKNCNNVVTSFPGFIQKATQLNMQIKEIYADYT